MENAHKIFVISLVFFALTQHSFAQRAFGFDPGATVNVNDSVVIRLNDYQGDIQWQKSPDLENWENIAAATLDTLLFVADTTTYFRAEVIAGDCDPFYSDTTMVEVIISGNWPIDNETEVVEVLNPATGKTWMDRNLGASRAATGSTDAEAYGDLYQWGRAADGHQKRTSNTISTLSSSDTPGHGDFILSPSTGDWRSPQNASLWQGLNGTNNPCPAGYRLPSDAELNAERLSWSSNNAAGAFASPLKLPLAGYRGYSDGSLNNVDSFVAYWSGSVSGTYSRSLHFSADTAGVGSSNRALGYSVRCLKDEIESVVPCPDFPTVTDFDGNIYNTVQLGKQCWMRENLKTTSYNDGDPIPNLSDINEWGTTEGGAYVWYDNDFETWGSIYGALYNWPAVHTDSLCPLGWHVPSDEEWQELEIFLGMTPEQADMQGARGTNQGGQMKSMRTEPDDHPRWKTPNNGATNSSGFSALPGGGRIGNLFNNIGTTSNWWTATTYPGEVVWAWNRSIVNFNTFVNRYPQGKEQGFSVRCIKDEPLKPTVTTTMVDDVTGNSASCGGEVTEEGTAPVTARGVVWSQTVHPTIEENEGITADGEGVGIFSSNLTGLASSTIYYVRAYATNSVGTAYGEELEFETEELVEVTTSEVIKISNNSALTGGFVVFAGISPITSRGIVWHTEENPTLDHNLGITPDSTGVGSFVSGINGLDKNSIYYVRAFATNDSGTTYGQSVQFTTTNDNYNYPEGFVNCGFDTEVKTVINPATGRTWMDRNLGADQVATNTTDENSYGDLYQWGRFADGHQCRDSEITTILSETDIPGHGSFIIQDQNPFDWRSTENNNLWQGLTGINNPCPDGFRLPTSYELSDERETWISDNITGAFRSPLKISLAGSRSRDYGSLYEVGVSTRLWSSTIGESNPWRLLIYTSDVFMGADTRASGFSVRCIKDEPEAPTITTSAVTGVTSNTAICGGEVTIEGDAPVTSRGVVWGKTPNPTITGNEGITTDGDGLGVFESSLTELDPETTYYVRAYAINTVGASYGNELSFETEEDYYPPGTVHCGEPTQVVDILNPSTGKTWMDRNLGATRVAIASDDADSYGDLYQWGRFADGHQCRDSETTTTLSTLDNPGHGDFILAPDSPYDWHSPQNDDLWQVNGDVNNPCPIGYRVPTEAEFNAELQSWDSNNTGGAFATPLKLPVAGYRHSNDGLLYDEGSFGLYWSGTVSGTTSRRLGFTGSEAILIDNGRAFGLSVRCIKIEPEEPSVTTWAVTDITFFSAKSGGEVTDDGGAPVTSRGVVWSQTPNSTVDINEGITSDGEGIGSFESNLEWLAPGSTYYVRAFAINSAGVSYGNEFSFVTGDDPYPEGTVHCNKPTEVVEVTSPITGQIWMDRNLGSGNVATSSYDIDSYGDLYQWGRFADGHQCRDSETTSTLSGSDFPDHPDFILAPDSPNDWRSPQNSNLWQGVDGANNPCPIGFRLPTISEWENERQNWVTNNTEGAFASPLKITPAGNRYHVDGSVVFGGVYGMYWSSTITTASSRALYFDSPGAYLDTRKRALGNSVRCIKD